MLDTAAAGTLPELVDVADIQGDLHMHTVYSDGRDSVAGMVHASRALGYRYMAITDHSPTARASRVLTLERIAAQAEEIAAVRALAPDITILQGIECDIQEDGSLDVPDSVLERLDIVLASMHESYGHSPARILQRYERVLRHPLVNVITHPGEPRRRAGNPATPWPSRVCSKRRPGRAPRWRSTARRVTSTWTRRWPNWPRRSERRSWWTATATWPSASAGRCGSAWGSARRAALTKHQVLNTRDVDAIRAFVSAKREGRPWQA